MKRTNHQTELKIVDLYTKKKLSLSKIAGQLRISMTAVHNALKRNGVDRRSISEGSKIYSVNNQYFNQIDSHIKAQILGMIYADGCVSINKQKSRKVFSICLAAKDDNYIKLIKDQLQYTGPINIYTNKDKGKFARLSVSDPKLIDDLVVLGVLPQKSLILTFPNFNQVPEQFIHSFVLGYLEGDGGIYCREDKRPTKITPRMSVEICVTKEFGESLQNYIKGKLDIVSKINIAHKYKKLKNPPNVYSFRVSGTQQVKKFLDWIYKDASFVMQRKHEIYQKICNFLKWRNENWEEIKRQSYIKMADKQRGKPKHSQEFKDKLAQLRREEKIKRNNN